MSRRKVSMKKDWDNPREHAMPEHARVPASFGIGGVAIAPATVLAPMAGVTDTVFRRFIRNASLFTTPQVALQQMRVTQVREEDLGSSGLAEVREASQGCSVDAEITNQQSGCGLIMTEFTSADGLARMRESKRKRYLTFYDDEHPIAAQIFGSNPKTLADAARIVQDTGFDIVDLNLGCPAKRVVACNGGSGLLRDLPLIGKIFAEIRAAVTIPFTVKFRLGWDDANLVHVALAKLAEDSGLNAVALHARTREQGYSGQARWEHIAAVKDAVKIPVIGNGDIRTPEDAVAMVAQDRMRWGDDRSRRSGESVDLSPDRAIHRAWPLRSAHRTRPLPDHPRLFPDARRRLRPRRRDGGKPRHRIRRPQLRPGKDETVRLLVHPRSARRRRAAQGDLRMQVRAGDFRGGGEVL